MFGSILRRWRLLAPMALVALASITIAAGSLTSASAAATKSVYFRYSGDAADFINYGTNPAFFDCFSGYLGPDGSGGTSIAASLDNCTDAGFTAADVTVSVDVAAWDVHAYHSKTEGHADATAADVGDGTVTFKDVDLLDFDEVQTTAETECQSNHNHLHSSAVSETTFNNLELFGSEAANNNFTSYANAFTNIATGGRTVQVVRSFDRDTVIYTFNERLKAVGRSFADISANGVHIIVQDYNGNIDVNVVIAHTHADIECSFDKFNFEDPIGF
jgi:hypothetical protein